MNLVNTSLQIKVVFVIPLRTNWASEPLFSSSVLFTIMVKSGLVFDIDSFMPTLYFITLRFKKLRIFTKAEKYVSKSILSIYPEQNITDYWC